MSRKPAPRVPRGVPAGSLRRTLHSVRRFRMNFLFGTLLVLFGLLLARLGKLQLVDAAQFQAEAASRHDGAWLFEPRRGRLLDRNGTPLAVPRPARRVGVDPAVVADARTFALVLSDFLGGEPHPFEIQRVVDEARAAAEQRGTEVSRYHVLIPFVDDPALVDRIDDLARIPPARQVKLGVYGVVVHPAEGRQYPNDDYAAHVLGQAPREGGAPGTGAEQAVDALLSGSTQRVEIYRDGRRRAYAKGALGGGLETTGRDVRLTLDVTVQHALETALDDLQARWSPQGACGVVLDPHTGDVLALAVRPTFDPNRQAAGPNLAIQGLYEPGSFFKPFTVAWALQQKAVTADEILEMPLRALLRDEKKAIGDTHHVGPGTVERLIAHSSNTGAALLGERLGPEGMRALFERVFPDTEHGTGCGLPYETGARLALDRAARAWPWWLVHRAAFGQGFSVTPLQMAAAFAAFARPDARPVQPRVFLADDRPAARGEALCAPEHLAVVRRGLEACAAEGTARAAFEGAPFRAAAKTATAQQWGSRDGRRVLLSNCSLAAYAPAEDPQVVVVVLVQIADDAGGYGGSVAAPAVRRVLEQVLSYWNVIRPGGAR